MNFPLCSTSVLHKKFNELDAVVTDRNIPKNSKGDWGCWCHLLPLNWQKSLHDLYTKTNLGFPTAPKNTSSCQRRQISQDRPNLEHCSHMWKLSSITYQHLDSIPNMLICIDIALSAKLDLLAHQRAIVSLFGCNCSFHSFSLEEQTFKTPSSKIVTRASPGMYQFTLQRKTMRCLRSECGILEWAAANMFPFSSKRQFSKSRINKLDAKY